MSAFVLTPSSFATSSRISIPDVVKSIRPVATPSYIKLCSVRATISDPMSNYPTTDDSQLHNSPPSVSTMKDFWDLADESKVNAQYEADGCIAFLKAASMDEIRSICLQYRYFVERYPDNLSLLLAKMPNLQLKSLLASILSEELGSGKIKNAHIFWYDRFLRSIGVTEEELQKGIYQENEEILSEIEYRCKAKPFEHVVGMVGMGGECLCQIYLTVMYKYLIMNENVKNFEGKIDWLFWTYHIGEEDIEHRKLVRICIDEMVMGGVGVEQLVQGYSFGKSTWDKFWLNNYKNTRFVTGN